MMNRALWRFVVVGAVIMSVCSVRAEAKALALWPSPHDLKLGQGSLDLKGKSICIPTAAGEKSEAIASVLANILAKNLKLTVVPKVIRKGASGKLPYVLSIGIGPEGWNAAAKKLLLDKVDPTLRDQAYFLDITPKGVVIVASGSWGLHYGAVTLMQLARNEAQGTKIPCLTILDWPSMELRGLHTARATDKHRQLAGSYAMDGKINMLVWENFMSAFSWETHPEIAHGRGRFETRIKKYGKVVQKVRALGVEVVPLRNLSIGHIRQSGLYPYMFLNDNETFYWAMKDIIDDELEVFTPRYFHFGMDEEKHINKMLYPVRTVNQWRDVSVEIMKHLRRRGVMGMMWTEILFPQWGGRSKDYDWVGCLGGKFPTGYEKFVATFPTDIIFVPWFYWTKTPEDTLDGKGDMRRQAKTGHPIVVGAYETHVLDHTEAVRMIKPKQPNVLGVLATAWDGRSLYQKRFPRHPEYVRRAAGPFWNRDKPGAWPPKGKEKDHSPFWGDGTGRHETFVWPEADTGISTLACLFDADLPKSINTALTKIKDKNWRIWIKAREQLVAIGLSAAPVLLAEMSKSTGEIQERIEGCLSRNARDSRNGRKRGNLNVAKVTPFLRNKNEAVRDIAAEILVSCSNKGLVKARTMIKDPIAGASCIRALRIVRDRKSNTDLIAIVANTRAPSRSRSEAAKSLGVLRITKGSAVLRTCLSDRTDKEVQKAAIWSLALINCTEADKQIAAFLKSKDDDIRYRSAIALTILKSSETKKLIPWLSKDRHSLECAAWSMWKTWKSSDALKVFKAAVKTQKDPTSVKRLEMLIEEFSGKKKPKWKF